MLFTFEDRLQAQLTPLFLAFCSPYGMHILKALQSRLGLKSNDIKCYRLQLTTFTYKMEIWSFEGYAFHCTLGWRKVSPIPSKNFKPLLSL